MSNITAAGPDRGLLDLLMGTNKPEPDAEGSFGNLMDLIKSLGEKDEDSRTDQETVPGKEAIDYRFVGNPGAFLNLGQPMPGVTAATDASGEANADPLSADASQLTGAANAAASAGEMLSPLGQVDAGRVNGMLKEKSLPPLNAQELDLLQRVNEKVAELNEETSADGTQNAARRLLSEIQSEQKGKDGPAAKAPANQAETQFVSELNRRGVDAQGVRGEEAKASDATGKGAEKFVSTESYLQLHGQKQATKGKGEEKVDAADGKNPRAGGPNQNPQGATEAVGEKGSKGKDLFSSLGGQVKAGPERDDKKADLAGPFSADLSRALRGAGDGSVKEVYVNPANSAEMRNALVGELNQNVGLTALKGGGEMRLVIRPDGLGEVKLKVEAKDGKIGVHVTAENEEVAKVLKGGSHELESSLRDQNLSLAKFEVTVSHDAPVAGSDTKNSFAESFTSHRDSSSGFDQNAGFSQGRHGESRFGTGDGQNPRSGSDGRRTEESTGTTRTAYRPAPGQRPAGMNGARGSSRLDVVA